MNEPNLSASPDFTPPAPRSYEKTESIYAWVCVLAGYLLANLASGKWQRILFAPTGALLSTTSVFQGESIPGIAHALVIEADKEDKA